MLTPEHSPLLVLVSVLVAVMAAFTALRITQGIKTIPVGPRRAVVARASFVFGGGIWAMHFVGMLAVELPEPLGFAALPTLLSALFAVLVVGVGFILLHFYWPGGTQRPLPLLAGAGTVMGLGVVGMHYIGMHALVGTYHATHDVAGPLLASIVAIAASTFGLWLAYRRRTMRDTLLGAVPLGLAICAMHYFAMAFTRFVPASDAATPTAVVLSGDSLAMVVAVAAFVICGLFLLMAAPARSPAAGTAERAVLDTEVVPLGSLPDTSAPAPGEGADDVQAPADGLAAKIPYERQNTVLFVAVSRIAAVRADGHYTWLITDEGELFCPWAISRVESAMVPGAFIRTHRSYLARVDRVVGFRRDGDRMLCLIEEDGGTEIPVSRGRVASVRQALGVA